MWPWEHLALAYALYSLYANVVRRDSPSGREAVAVGVGSQVPDLVDKPLAWTLEVAPTGYFVAHSIFVAPFVCLVAFGLARKRGAHSLAGAFSIAYLSHPIADVINPLFLGRPVEPRAVLWPVASPPTGDYGGFVDHVGVYVARYVELLASGPTLSPPLAFTLGLGATVLALWLFDGAPIASDLWRWTASRLRR